MTDHPFTVQWLVAVTAACDEVFASTGLVWRFQRSQGIDGLTQALLWEADPEKFLERFPETHVNDSYDEEWPPPCLDFWVELQRDPPVAQLTVEGWPDPGDQAVSGDPQQDADLIAGAFAQVFRG